MKIAWLVLLISAFTDGIIAGGTGLTSAMVATGSVTLPSPAVWLLSCVAGLLAAARTIQQALKVTPETTRLLKGVSVAP